MKNTSGNLPAAIKDYVYFLEEKYPQKSVLKLIGDRYKLTGSERAMLYRGITTNENCKQRSLKLIRKISGNNNELHIDTFNQVYTISSYLNGDMVFIGNDGFLRDASEIHGKIIRTELLERSIDLILQYLENTNIKDLTFYLDKQINRHKQVAGIINKKLLNFKLSIQTEISEKVDNILIKTETGIIASSDSQIIDKSKLKIFDLALHILEFHFNPKIIDLRSFLL